jgi:hypothetical protein
MKERQQARLVAVTDEAVVRAECAKAARGRAALAGPAVEAEQRRVAERKAARRELTGALERLVEQDEAASAAAQRLRSGIDRKREARFGPEDAPRRRRSGLQPGSELFAAAPGEQETLLFTSEHYSYWTYGSVYDSSFNDDAATDYAFSMYSDDGEPDSPVAGVGFNVALQTFDPIAFLDIRPLMRYEVKTRLTSSEHWLGDGEARGRIWLSMVVWQDGRAVTGSTERQLWADSVSGSSRSYENDDWVQDFSAGFEMRPGLPYVVEVGLWANCDSSCYGSCGGAFLDQWLRLIWVAATGTVTG